MAERNTSSSGGGQSESGIGGKYSMRLSMPSDDDVVRAFAEAQGPRSLAPAVRQLIHMWVNEFGAVSVIDTVTSTVTLPGLSAIARTPGRFEQPVEQAEQAERPVATGRGVIPDPPYVPPMVESALVPELVPEPAQVAPDPVAPIKSPESSTSSDVNAIFRGHG